MLRPLRILIGAIGWRNTWAVVRHMRRRQRAGEPFGEFAPPDCEEERLSRAQIGPAILLYRALLAQCPQDAMTVTERVVVEDGIRFMRRTLGVISPTRMAALTPENREAFAQAKAKRFFNATIRWDRMEEDEVQFTVTACRFPPLCAAAGVPEIASLFCAVDAQYFGSVEENVLLERPQTIASGAANCPFTLRIASTQRSE